MQTGETNFVAMAGFALFIGLSLVITWFAARRTTIKPAEPACVAPELDVTPMNCADYTMQGRIS